MSVERSSSVPTGGMLSGADRREAGDGGRVWTARVPLTSSRICGVAVPAGWVGTEKNPPRSQAQQPGWSISTRGVLPSSLSRTTFTPEGTDYCARHRPMRNHQGCSSARELVGVSVRTLNRRPSSSKKKPVSWGRPVRARRWWLGCWSGCRSLAWFWLAGLASAWRRGQLVWLVGRSGPGQSGGTGRVPYTRPSRSAQGRSSVVVSGCPPVGGLARSGSTPFQGRRS